MCTNQNERYEWMLAAECVSKLVISNHSPLVKRSWPVCAQRSGGLGEEWLLRLEVLYFQWNELRELSRKNVERLKEVFRTDNIRRLEPRNHIPAVVDQVDLDDAIQASEISAESLLSNPDNDPPVLTFPARHRLTCLHGRHRIQAAREILPPTDAWWTVDLYLAGMSTLQRRKDKAC